MTYHDIIECYDNLSRLKMNQKNKNVLIAFFLLFTGNLTILGTSETILRAFRERTAYNVNGFLSAGISYAFSFLATPFMDHYFFSGQITPQRTLVAVLTRMVRIKPFHVEFQ